MTAKGGRGYNKVELPEDVFWKGVSYYDLCKAEKELKEIADKQ